jgi:two-component system sensor histidine kinase BaeS
MTRRLTLAIVGVVAATLLLAGGATLLLARVGARQATADQLRRQADDVAAGLSVVSSRQANPRAQLAVLRRVLRLNDVSLVAVGPAGVVRGELPDGVTAADLDVTALRNGEVVSGSHGSLVYAAAGRPVGSTTAIAVLTRDAEPLLGPARRLFLVAGAATLLVGVVVALRLSRALTEPIRRADAVTRRIAGGDLAARVPEPPARAQDELADLSRGINAMAATLERSRGLEQQFLLSVSHDLRTPLTSIRGYAEAIADGTAGEPVVAAGVILTESRRLDRLVRDLLDLARLDARQFSLRLEPVDVGDVATHVTEGFRPEADEAGVRLTLATPGAGGSAGVVATADPDRLAQVVANLVENALKYATAEVRVAVAADGGSVRLTVEDDGPGIAAEDLPHVFERLYVARRQPRRRETGSGLGLAIVRELVGAMGGDVRAEAAAGPGTRLVVTLPRSSA